MLLELTVDLDAIVANWRRLGRMSAPAECAAVVKANVVLTSLIMFTPGTSWIELITDCPFCRSSSRPAMTDTEAGVWLGCYCDDCKQHGYEARTVQRWIRVVPA